MCETRKTPTDLPLDCIAQVLGLDVFDYELADVLRMIDCLNQTNQDLARENAALRGLPTALTLLDTTTACGGCGNTEPANRCLGCRHDFTVPGVWTGKEVASA